MIIDKLTYLIEKEYLDRGFDKKYINISYDSKIGRISFDDHKVQTTYLFDLDNNISYDGGIKVKEKLRGQGIGSQLVETREAICKKLDIEFIILGIVLDSLFWKNRGYKKLGIYKRIKLKKRLRRVIFSYKNWPRYKEL